MLMKINMTLMPNQHDSGRFNMMLMEINVMLMPTFWVPTRPCFEKLMIFALESLTLDYHWCNFSALTADSERASKTERFEYPYWCILLRMRDFSFSYFPQNSPFLKAFLILFILRTYILSILKSRAGKIAKGSFGVQRDFEIINAEDVLKIMTCK